MGFVHFFFAVPFTVGTKRCVCVCFRRLLVSKPTFLDMPIDLKVRYLNYLYKHSRRYCLLVQGLLAAVKPDFDLTHFHHMIYQAEKHSACENRT